MEVIALMFATETAIAFTWVSGDAILLQILSHESNPFGWSWRSLFLRQQRCDRVVVGLEGDQVCFAEMGDRFLLGRVRCDQFIFLKGDRIVLA